MNYHDSKAVLDKCNNNLACICRKRDGWFMVEYMDDPGDCAPEGTGNYYLQCRCGVTVPMEVAAQRLSN